jgi:pseudouridine-5'-phosphate glycosidase
MENSFYTRESTYLRIRSEVQEALDSDAPILALESSVIAHGLPYPQNLETAQQMEDLVRQEGTTPATIAILGGQIRIGLSHEELAHLATTKGIQKVARRELPVVVAKELDGATTVAGTMYLAQRVGIDVLATGGIGGVHRQHPFDISADLQELARTPVAVVCSGAKAILDLPGTLERLETYGVPVFGYGSDRFPAFYSRDSGLPVSARVDTPEETAHIIQIRRGLGVEGGVLVVVPIPREEEIPHPVIEEAIAQALVRAEEDAITGQAVTPFLLTRVAELTKGLSVRANIALLRNNAIIAARLARALKTSGEQAR